MLLLNCQHYIAIIANSKFRLASIMFIDYHDLDFSQGTVSLKPEILFRHPPRQRNTYYTIEHRRSWTNSRETYENAARREYELLLSNYRQANHEIVIGYWREFFIQDLLGQFSMIKDYLKQIGIIAYHVAEISDNGFGKPVNQIHYHFLIDYYYSKSRLIKTFKDACRYAGLQIGKDCIVKYASIPDRETFKRKAKYILKYDTFKEQAILFRTKTGIDKTGMINDYFINADGTKASKKKCGSQSFPVGIPTMLALLNRSQSD